MQTDWTLTDDQSCEIRVPMSFQSTGREVQTWQSEFLAVFSLIVL